MKPWRLRTRLTAWYACALVLILGAFAIVLTWQQGRIGLRRVDRELGNLCVTVEGLLRDELSETPDENFAAREVVKTVAAPGREVAVATRDRRVLASAPADWEPWRSLAVPSAMSSSDTPVIGSSPDDQFRFAVRRVDMNGRTFLVVAAAPLADAWRERHEAQEAMWVGLPMLFVLAVLGGLWLSAAALRPIADMAHRASALPVDGAENLGASGRDDELGQLERSFNGLLARLRATLATQRQFMADASHELRTPVSVMRSAADVTLDRPERSEAEYRDALAIVQDQAKQAGRLLEDMLMLARADAGGYPIQPEQFYLDEVIYTSARSLDNLAEHRRVSIFANAAPDLAFTGDEPLVRRMLVNLLVNAVQHARSRVNVVVTREGSGVVIRIADDGRGVPAGERDRIFDRFVQLDPSRRHAGAGLGLPISRWIAEAHRGSLILEASSDEGSIFTASLVSLDRADAIA